MKITVSCMITAIYRAWFLCMPWPTLIQFLCKNDICIAGTKKRRPLFVIGENFHSMNFCEKEILFCPIIFFATIHFSSWKEQHDIFWQINKHLFFKGVSHMTHIAYPITKPFFLTLRLRANICTSFFSFPLLEPLKNNILKKSQQLVVSLVSFSLRGFNLAICYPLTMDCKLLLFWSCLQCSRFGY